MRMKDEDALERRDTELYIDVKTTTMNTADIIINLGTLLFGGGVGWIINWSANRRKAKGEAAQTEAEAMKSVQDVYQQALADQQTYISQLRETRDHLISDRDDQRKENNELRKRLNEMEAELNSLKNTVARNNRMLANLRPFLCGRASCAKRTEVDLGDSDSSDSEE